MSDSERIQADVLDRWWDGCVDPTAAAVPTDESDLTHFIRRLHEGAAVAHADSVVSDRLCGSLPQQLHPKWVRLVRL
jgi:hypothetical protein